MLIPVWVSRDINTGLELCRNSRIHNQSPSIHVSNQCVIRNLQCLQFLFRNPWNGFGLQIWCPCIYFASYTATIIIRLIGYRLYFRHTGGPIGAYGFILAVSLLRLASPCLYGFCGFCNATTRVLPREQRLYIWEKGLGLDSDGWTCG